MRGRWTLTAKLYTSGITFLVLALTSIGLTLWVTWNLEGGAAAVNEAGRMRMQTYRLALELSSRHRLGRGLALVRSFDESLALLRSGDPSRPLFVPWSAATRANISTASTRSWAELRERWLHSQPTAAEAARDAGEFVALVDGFVAAIESQIARWTAILHLFQLAMLALAIAGAVAMLYAGYLFVLNPLARLKRGVISMQQGDLSTRVEVDSNDEFGQLSAGFNDMAHTLQSLYGSLEDKVREKTARLEVKRQRLADLYEVSAFLAHAPPGCAGARLRAPGARASPRPTAWRCAGPTRATSAICCWPATAWRRPSPRSRPAWKPAPAIAGSRARRPRSGRSRSMRSDPRRWTIAARAGFRTLVSVPVKLHERVLGEVDLFFRARCQPGRRGARPARHAGQPHGQRDGKPARGGARARGRRRAGARAAGAGAARFDRPVAGVPEDPGPVAARRRAPQDAAAMARVVGELDTGVRESYADVRELLVHFRTRTNEEDIEPALRTTLSKFEHQTGLAVRLETEGHGVALAPDVQVQVLHILQEALSNVRKHARRPHVVLRVSRTPCWRFEVQDDGQGFDAATADRRRDPRRAAHHAGAGAAHRRAGPGRVGARPRLHGRARIAGRAAGSQAASSARRP